MRASEARPRIGSTSAEFRHSQSAVAAALCWRTPKSDMSHFLRTRFEVGPSSFRCEPIGCAFLSAGGSLRAAEFESNVDRAWFRQPPAGVIYSFLSTLRQATHWAQPLGPRCQVRNWLGNC